MHFNNLTRSFACCNTQFRKYYSRCLSPSMLFFLKFNGRRLRVSKILLNWSNVAAICQSLSYKTWSSIPPVGVRGMSRGKFNFLTEVENSGVTRSGVSAPSQFSLAFDFTPKPLRMIDLRYLHWKIK